MDEEQQKEWDADNLIIHMKSQNKTEQNNCKAQTSMYAYSYIEIPEKCNVSIDMLTHFRSELL